jgi:basic membrane protein A
MGSQASHSRRRFRTAGVLSIAVLAVVGLVATACGSSDSGSSSNEVKAAWIYVGPTNDGGWTQAHDNGRKFAETELGSGVKIGRAHV